MKDDKTNTNDAIDGADENQNDRIEQRQEDMNDRFYSGEREMPNYSGTPREHDVQESERPDDPLLGTETFGENPQEKMSDNDAGERDRSYGNLFGTQRDLSYGGEAPYSKDYSDDWLEAGPHTGRGPKGYKRSDERILEEANDRLTQHGGVDASNIEVSVEEGEITLEGTVESRRVKRLAEDALETISGVIDIHNRLRVQ